METSENVGKLLYFLKEKKEARYSELLKALGLSSAGLTKILDKLVSKNLVLRELKLDRSVYYRLNESRMDEINKLLRSYLEHEKKEVEEKMQVIKQVIPEKERIRMASYFIAVDEEKRKRIEKMLEEILGEGEAK